MKILLYNNVLLLVFYYYYTTIIYDYKVSYNLSKLKNTIWQLVQKHKD